MAFNNSILTLDGVRKQFIRRRKDEEITPSDVLDAVNDFYSFMQRIEMEMYPDRFRQISAVVSVDANGFDLAGILDLGSDRRGFQVYKNSIDSKNRLFRRHPASSFDGFYIINNKVFMTNLPSIGTQNIQILYMTKTTKLSLDAPITTVLAIDQDLELALRQYVRNIFYDGQYQIGLRQEAENKTIEELSRYFATTSESVSIDG